MTNEIAISRRRALTWAAAGAASTVALPGAVFAQPAKKATILQGSGSVLLAWAPSYIAEELGYYREEGLAVDRIFNGSGPAGMGALVGGSGTIFLNPPGEPLTAAARGQKFKFLMSESNHQASLIVLSKEFAAKHGVTEDMPLAQKLAVAKKFKGIRCGVTSPGSLSDHAARAAFLGAGLVPGTDAQILPLGTVPNAMAAMSRGAIDAFSGASPAGEIAQSQQGAVIFFSNLKGEIPGYKALSGHLMVARAGDVDANPELFAALVRADTRALRYIVEQPQAAGDVLFKARYNTMNKDIWSVVWRANLPQFRSPYLTKPSVEAWVTMGVMPSQIDLKAVDLDRMIDMKFVDQAVQKLGWKVSA